MKLDKRRSFVLMTAGLSHFLNVLFSLQWWGEGQAEDLSPVFKLHCQLSCADEINKVDTSAILHGYGCAQVGMCAHLAFSLFYVALDRKGS